MGTSIYAYKKSSTRFCTVLAMEKLPEEFSPHKFSADDLGKVPYLNQIIDEIVRVYG